ncbi:MAG: GtrA family protein [Deferribacterales bacterium]
MGLLDRRFIVFLIVGVLNTVFGYGLFALFIFFGLHYTLAVLFSTVLGVLFNFKTIGTIVFRDGSNRLITKFVSVYAFLYVLNISGLKLLDMAGTTNKYISGGILLLPLAMLSFLLNKKFVFNRNS